MGLGMSQMRQLIVFEMFDQWETINTVVPLASVTSAESK
jgi:hypothetical protein